jgi:hypothetical protein
MFAGSLVLGITLCCFAAWLHWNETQGWPNELFVTDLDKQYRDKRSRSRAGIHAIIAVCGLLVLIAACAGAGAVWLAAWTCVILGLFAVIFLAGIDALRTHRYHAEKLPEIRREVLGDDD